MTEWFQETNGKEKNDVRYAWMRRQIATNAPTGLENRGQKNTKEMLLYFFSGDIPSLVVQVLGTVSRCKHKLPKTGLVFPPEGCIFI